MAASSLKFQRFIQSSCILTPWKGPTFCTLNNTRCIQLREYSDQKSKSNKIRIGCASGFFGDTAVSAPQLIHKGKLDFLVFDYLSEITMSLLTAAKAKKSDLGYAPDFVQAAVGPYMKDIKNKGVKVISNAGGVNPASCVTALTEAATKAGVQLNIAMVTGDDIMPMKKELLSGGMTEIDSGMPIPKTMHSMNAYLGAGAIARALDLGADIVVTGRCVDSALVLAPLMHKFKWSVDKFNLLASASLAGHLIECGAQATGGVFTDWHTVPDWHNIGFPIVECEENGDFVLTKPPQTGGLVSFGTVAEQMVYEIGDPCNYVLPDVICDFSQVKIHPVAGEEGEAVRVTGATGKPPSETYKVSGTYADGFRATAVSPIGGPRAVAKAKKTADAIITRCRGIFKQVGLDDFTDVNSQILGSEQTYGAQANSSTVESAREAVLWLAVHHSQKKALEIFSREVAPAGTGMAPGLTGIVGGRPRVSPVLKLYSFLYPKSNLNVEIHMNGEFVEEYKSPHFETQTSTEADISSGEGAPLETGSHSFRLEDLAYTRSGDKGNSCVVARHASYVPYLRQALTADVVEKYFSHMFDANTQNNVTRYEVPGIGGFNFLLRNSLGGGGIASLRSDPQGKAYGQMLLDLKLDNLPNLIDMAKE